MDITGPLVVTFLFGTPVIAIIAGVSCHMWKQYLQTKERMHQLKIANSNKPNEDLIRMIEDLRREVAQLRDTTTQYDMSIDKTLHTIEHRLSYLEQKPYTNTTVHTNQQSAR